MNELHQDCRYHLLSVLDGQSPDLPRISFPNSARMRAAVILSAAAAITHAWHELQVEDCFCHEQYRSVVFKIAAYVSKTGLTARELMAKQEEINFAILCFWTEVCGRMGLGRMLKEARIIKKRNAIELLETVGDPVEVRRSICGRFKLVELRSAAHLVAEGEALDHCMRYRKTPTGRLFYFQEILQGRSRIFSLRRCGSNGSDDERIATVEIELKDRLLTIQPALDRLEQSERWHCLILIGAVRGEVVPWVRRANRLLCLNLAKRHYLIGSHSGRRLPRG